MPYLYLICLYGRDSLQVKNEIHCKFMLALGNIGLGNKDKGLVFLSEVEKIRS